MAHDSGSTGGAYRRYHKWWLGGLFEICDERCWKDVEEIHSSASPQNHNVCHGDRTRWISLVREMGDHKMPSCRNHCHESWGLCQQRSFLFLTEEAALGKNWVYLQLVGGRNSLVVVVLRMVHSRHLEYVILGRILGQEAFPVHLWLQPQENVWEWEHVFVVCPGLHDLQSRRCLPLLIQLFGEYRRHSDLPWLGICHRLGCILPAQRRTGGTVVMIYWNLFPLWDFADRLLG